MVSLRPRRFCMLFLAATIAGILQPAAWAHSSATQEAHCVELHEAFKSSGLVRSGESSYSVFISGALESCQAAVDGSVEAQVKLGDIFSLLNLHEHSVFWMKRAADQNDPDAMTKLVQSYRLGRGVEKNEAEAARLLRAAAEAGHPAAMGMMGEYHRSGTLGFPQDNDKGIELMQRAADLGDGYSLSRLGQFTIRQDEQAGLALVRRGAERGDAYAAWLYGTYLLEGQYGLQVDDALGIQYLSLAATAGNRSAQDQLGREYITAKRVPANHDLAKFWLSQAAAQGDEFAQRTLDRQLNWQSSAQAEAQQAVFNAALILGLVAILTGPSAPPADGEPWRSPYAGTWWLEPCDWGEIRMSPYSCVEWP